MNLKPSIIALSIAASLASMACAADMPAPASAPSEQRIAQVADKVAAPAETGAVRAVGKTREQVIDELIQARKDGSYLVVPEAYPEAFYFRAAR